MYFKYLSNFVILAGFSSYSVERRRTKGGINLVNTEYNLPEGESDDPVREKVAKLLDKTKSLTLELDDLVIRTTDIGRLNKLEKYLDWIILKTNKVREEPVFSGDDIPDLFRGDVVLMELGFNIGEEFGGRHAAIVLRNSNKRNKRVLVLPITSKEPKNKHLPIYVKIGRIGGMDRNKQHWANVGNIKTISKQRIIYPPERKNVNGRVLSRISSAITNQWAKRN